MNIKKVSIILCLSCVIMLGAIGIGLYRTLTFGIPDFSLSDNKVIDLTINEKSLNNLSKIIQTPAISNINYEETDFEQFDNFLIVLKKTYPEVFNKLEYIPINKYSILLILRAEEKTDKLPILITGHYDTVGVDLASIDNWKYPPFDGVINDNKIWGRGTLDDRASFTAIFEAIDALLKEGFKPKSDIYFAFGHDEEVGGKNGAKEIAKYLKENDLKFEIVLDEGGRVDLDENGNKIAYVGIGEKGRYAFDLLIKSKGGHASRPLKTSSIVKLGKVVNLLNDNQMKPMMSNELLEYYKKTFFKRDFYTKFLIANANILKPLLLKRLSNYPLDNAYIRTTTAFTMLDGAMASNIIPDVAKVTGDFRIIPNNSKEDIEKHIKDVLEKNAKDIEYEIKPFYDEAPSSVSSIENNAFKKLSDEIKKEFECKIVIPFTVTGGTDARYYEEVSNSIYRFLPVILNEEEYGLMHGVNEFITIENYARMIKFYKSFIENFYN